MYKSRRCPPAPACCPAPGPTAPSPPRGVWGVPGLPAPRRGTGHPPCTAPASPAHSPPAPGLQGEAREGGDPNGPQTACGAPAAGGSCGATAPACQPWGEGLGGSNEPHPPRKTGRAGEGRGCTRTHSICLWGGGTGYGRHPPVLGKLRHSEGHSLTGGLCLAELRQGPALSTRLKQRKTASHVCVPSSAGSAQLGWHHPACSGGPGLLPPPAGAAAAPALAKGEACTPLLAALVGTPPTLPEQRDLTLPTRDAGRSWRGQGLLARPGAAPSLCARNRMQGGQAHPPTHRVWPGVLQTHSWGQGGTEKSWGPTGGLGVSPEGSRVGRKHPRPVLALELGQNPPCPASPGTEPSPGGSAGRASASPGPGGGAACRSPP